MRLVRRVGGQEAELWRVEKSTPSGEDFILTLDCYGERLTGFVDGQQQFDLDDPALPDGTVGLSCASELTATVHELRIGEPDWRLHFVFGRERTMSAGSRIEVHSGSPASANQHWPGGIPKTN